MRNEISELRKTEKLFDTLKSKEEERLKVELEGQIKAMQ